MYILLRPCCKKYCNVGFPLEYVSFPLSNVGFPLSNVSFPLSNVGFPLSNVSFPLSNVGFPLSSGQWSVVSGQRSAVSVVGQCQWLMKNHYWLSELILHCICIELYCISFSVAWPRDILSTTWSEGNRQIRITAKIHIMWFLAPNGKTSA